MPVEVITYGLFAGYVVSWVLCGILLWHGYHRKRDLALSLGLGLLGLCILATFVLVYIIFIGKQLRDAGQ